LPIACDEPLQRVHIVDSANFPTVGSSTIAYTIMANADRIARACAELDAA
jgi:choline dehydrogenase-like flavoprotein